LGPFNQAYVLASSAEIVRGRPLQAVVSADTVIVASFNVTSVLKDFEHPLELSTKTL